MVSMALAKKKKNQKLFFGSLVVVIIVAAILCIAFTFAEEETDVTKPKIAVIPIHGQLSLSDGKAIFGGEVSGIQSIIDLIKKAEKDTEVKAIIFEINSPGGTVVASEELAAAIKSTKKPTVALLREVAASGAYWVATACDKIVADPATVTGSIGVTGSYLQFSKLMENYGITYERLVSGPYKDTGSPYRELTQAEREMMMKKINAINSLFIDAISTNRGLNRSYVESIATGEIFLGVEAYELKLVDALGGRKQAKHIAEQLAGIKESKLVTMKKKISFWDIITKRTSASAYWIGRGIGDAWNIFLHKEDYALKAEI